MGGAVSFRVLTSSIVGDCLSGAIARGSLGTRLSGKLLGKVLDSLCVRLQVSDHGPEGLQLRQDYLHVPG